MERKTAVMILRARKLIEKAAAILDDEFFRLEAKEYAGKRVDGPVDAIESAANGLMKVSRDMAQTAVMAELRTRRRK